jgi:hypothetical protein
VTDPTITFEASESEVIRLHEYISRNAPVDRRLDYAFRISIVLFCGAFVLHETRALTYAGIAVAVSALGLYFLRPSINRLIWRARFRGTKNRTEGPSRLTLEAGGIRVASALGEGILRWPAVDRIDVDPTLIYFLSGTTVMGVPLRAFGTSDEAQDFVRRARELKQASTTSAG